MDSGRIPDGSALHRGRRNREIPVDAHVSDRRPALLRLLANAEPEETKLACGSQSNRPKSLTAEVMSVVRVSMPGVPGLLGCAYNSRLWSGNAFPLAITDSSAIPFFTQFGSQRATCSLRSTSIEFAVGYSQA